MVFQTFPYHAYYIPSETCHKLIHQKLSRCMPSSCESSQLLGQCIWNGYREPADRYSTKHRKTNSPSKLSHERNESASLKVLKTGKLHIQVYETSVGHINQIISNRFKYNQTVTLNGHVPSTKCPLPNICKRQTKSNRPWRP